MLHTLWRIGRTGVATALIVFAAGWVIGRARFGSTDQAAITRIEGELRRQFATSAETFARITGELSADHTSLASAARAPASARRLFDAAEAALPEERAGRMGITIYDAAGAPAAWAGRTSELTRSQIAGPASLLVAAGNQGARLVRIEPVLDRTRQPAARLATIVVEEQLGPVRATPGTSDTFTMFTSLVPVSLRTISDVQTALHDPYTFQIPSPSGGPLVEAEVSPSSLEDARGRWRGGVTAATLSVLGLTLVLAVGPWLERRRLTRSTSEFIATTIGAALTIVAARLAFWFALTPIVGTRPPTAPFDLFLSALAGMALVWIALDTVERWRIVGPRPCLLLGQSESVLWIGLTYTAAGILAATILWRYERLLDSIAAQSTVDLLHFSLHPVNAANASRIALALGLVLLHAAVFVGVVVATRLPSVWRTRRPFARRLAFASWAVGAVLAIPLIGASLSFTPLPLAVATAGIGSYAVSRLGRTVRHASQAARLWAFFLVLAVPALALYPSLVAFVTEAKERLIATEYGPQVARQREDLQDALYTALSEIDAQPALADLVAESGEDTTPTTDRAFLVWSETDLDVYRLTSAVELYGADGRLISRFANFPEYGPARHQAVGCTWDDTPLDEVLKSGSSELHVLRTSRGICDRGRVIGAVVVSVVLDYQTLPFIESHSPYLEPLEPLQPGISGETAFGRDVEFAVYGWSRAPEYPTGATVWPLSDAMVQRLATSRSSFWTSIVRDGVTFRVFLMSDRGSIYALGYPVITGFRHLMNLGELVFLTGVLFVMLLAGVALIASLTSRTPSSGRALLREIRASFYRRLFLAFVATAVGPVVVLAFATRAYLANQLNAGVRETAAKTALVAQRLVEDYATLQAPGGANALTTLDDQIMVLVQRAIDQDVNLFERAQLQATSKRDLFASGLLPKRTPSDVYRWIVLDRMPTYVGEEVTGDSPYLLAAAPVRTGNREGIVTVPVTLRQQEIEQQKDDLDRQILSAAVLFSLLGAALGYSMAERIADPINRLTRATRRIARGNLDARVAAAASDELGRLINDFNGMAEDLKRQRTELERTQRLEAWADMARQVAHDIKNPLTPIQLSAEHARRVNIDRGRPLSPVLDDCIASILSQVRLLRQIAAEFSSFASSATPRPAPTDLGELLEEIVGPYRSGLSGRIVLETSVAADVPTLNVDRNLLGRAFTNVIENALHAMPGGGSLTMRASRRSAASADTQVEAAGPSRGDGVAIEFIDTGIGMDPESCQRIFEPYFSTKAAGTGLGLTIAKRNVELNGGTIDVTSQKGVGTTVTMTLPLTRTV
jgi:signal transduction histidine kinase